MSSIIFVLVNYWFWYSCVVLAYVHHIYIFFLNWLKDKWYWYTVVCMMHTILFNNICALMFSLEELGILWIKLYRNPDFLIFCMDVYIYVHTCIYVYIYINNQNDKINISKYLFYVYFIGKLTTANFFRNLEMSHKI